ncbi:MAG: SDR family NAD(P)-dependent oxidoreductase [Armatimonadota bacterium]|nr:SDR family NAD(P)-dependent oxidoreductase [Armatimonadota bacterium]
MVIIGATSGIGRALALEFSRRGWVVGATGRRVEALEALVRESPSAVFTCPMDVRFPEEATRQLDDLLQRMGSADVVVVCAGIARTNLELEWTREAETIATNVAGFAAIATAAMRFFEHQGWGHLVGISSIAGLRGSYTTPAYSASKAFAINYLEGLRVRARLGASPIYVTDIRPGFVESEMTAGQQGMFWVAPAHKAAAQIYRAIERRKPYAYITRRWVLIAALMRVAPEWLRILVRR